MQEYIESILAPKLQGDGGWVEFVSLEGDQLTLIFRGECSKCHILKRCTAWMEQEIKRDLGVAVTIAPVCKKPFFWDT